MFITLLPRNDLLLGILILIVALFTGLIGWLGRRYPHLSISMQNIFLAGLIVGAAVVHPFLAFALVGGWLLLQYGQVSAPSIPDWLWLFVLGLVARLPHLAEPLWYDEMFTAYVANLPYLQLGEAMIQGDVHPPLWTALQWFLKFLFDRSEVALRLPGLIFSLLSILLGHRLALRLGLGRSTARITGLLLALLPAQIYFGNEARAYSLLVCLTLGMLLAILEDRPAWFLLCGALSGWTHNLGYIYLLLVGGLALLYIFYTPQRRFIWLVSVGGAGLMALPWLPFLLIQTRDVSQDYWIQPLLLPGVFRPVLDMTVGQELPAESILLLYTVAILLTLLALKASWGWIGTRSGLVWLGFVVGTPVTIALISAVWQPIYLSRTLLPCVTALMVAWAFVWVRSSFARRIAMALLLVGLWVFYGQSRPAFAPNFEACAGADTAYFINTSVRIAADYYLSMPNKVLWVGAYNYTDGLSPEAVRGLAISTGDLHDLKGEICVVYRENILSTERERAELERILAQSPDATAFTSGEFRIYRMAR